MNGPSPIRIHEIAGALLAEARAGETRPTVTELARRTGIARPTLYRSHPDVVTEFLTHATRHHEATPNPPKPTQQLVNRIAKLRQENEELRLHVEHYEEHIRRLTVENTPAGRPRPLCRGTRRRRPLASTGRHTGRD